MKSQKELIKVLKQMQKKQDVLEKKVTKLLDQKNAQDAAADAATAAGKDKSWLKQFVEDSDLDVLNDVKSAGSTAAAGISFTHFHLKKNLSDDQKNRTYTTNAN